MTHYNIIAEQEHTTVMAHYEALPREERGYQSEAELEAAFIKQLRQFGISNPSQNNIVCSVFSMYTPCKACGLLSKKE